MNFMHQILQLSNLPVEDDFFYEVSSSAYRLNYIFTRINHLPKALKSRIDDNLVHEIATLMEDVEEEVESFVSECSDNEPVGMDRTGGCFFTRLSSCAYRLGVVFEEIKPARLHFSAQGEKSNA